MILDIKKTYNKIEEDIILNQRDVFNMYNTYTTKYSKLSNKINDVNVGLFLNDYQQPTVQIFIRNKTGYIKSHIIFNKEGNRILDINELNYKINA